MMMELIIQTLKLSTTYKYYKQLFFKVWKI